MSPETKQYSLDLLRNSVSLVDKEKAEKLKNGLSILERMKNSLDLGPFFKNWKIESSFMSENGLNINIYTPYGLSVNSLPEHLIVTTCPNLYDYPISKLVFRS